MRSTSFLSVLTIQVISLILVSTAFGQRRADISIAAIRQMNQDSTLNIKGALSCNMGAANTGAPCELLITEAGSGDVYRLVEKDGSAPALGMKLYHSGKRQVAVQGKRGDGQNLTVTNIETF